jgi:hypothetical protein
LEDFKGIYGDDKVSHYRWSHPNPDAEELAGNKAVVTSGWSSGGNDAKNDINTIARTAEEAGLVHLKGKMGLSTFDYTGDSPSKDDDLHAWVPYRLSMQTHFQAAELRRVEADLKGRSRPPTRRIDVLFSKLYEAAKTSGNRNAPNLGHYDVSHPISVELSKRYFDAIEKGLSIDQTRKSLAEYLATSFKIREEQVYKANGWG